MRKIERTIVKANRKEFTKLFDLKHGTPGHTQIGTIFNRLNPADMIQAFNAWASQFRDIIEAAQGVAGDGKGLGATVESIHSSEQNFQAMVSFFAHEKQLVLGLSTYEHGKESEIPCVHQLLDILSNKGITLTLDALHCQKKR